MKEESNIMRYIHTNGVTPLKPLRFKPVQKGMTLDGKPLGVFENQWKLLNSGIR